MSGAAAERTASVASSPTPSSRNAPPVKGTADHESGSEDDGKVMENPALTEEDLKARKAAAKKKRKQEAAKRKKAQAAAAATSNTALPPSSSPSQSRESTIPSRMDGLQAAFPNLSMHEYFNDNDNSSKLAFSRTKGRHVLATRPIPAGHTVFRMSAYAAVVNDAYIRTCCHGCFQHAANLTACSSCWHARYCSAKCKSAMSSIHNLECDALGRLKLLDMKEDSVSLRLLIRICYLQHQEKLAIEKKHTSKPGQSFTDCSSLISHIEDQLHEAKAHILRLLLDLQKRVLRKDEAVWRSGEFDLQTCMRIMFQIQSNAHHITEINRLSIGLGLFLPASYINHSCDPNCVSWFDETGRMILQSIRPIAVGEEITYSYIDLYQPRELRSLLLREAFFIRDCQCDRCTKTSEKVAPDLLMRAMICSSCGSNPLHEYKTACESGKVSLNASKLPLLKYDKSNTGSMYCPAPHCGKMYKKAEIDQLIHNAQSLSQQAFTLAQGGEQAEAVSILENEVLYPRTKSSSSSSPANQPFFHPYHYALFNTYSHLVSILASIHHPTKEDCIRTLHYLSAMLECLTSQGFDHHPQAADALKLKGDVLMQLEKYDNKDMFVRESPALVRNELSDAEIVAAGIKALSIRNATTQANASAASTTLTSILPISSLPNVAFQCYSTSLLLRTTVYGKAHSLSKTVDATIADLEKAFGKMKVSRATSESSSSTSDLNDMEFIEFEDVKESKKKMKHKSNVAKK